MTAGETVLIHAAAGGTGVLAVQLAKHFGATVIGVASSDAKLDLVRTLGADHVINSRKADVISEALRLTDGKGVDVVWDPVGGEVFEQSPRAMAEGGRLVSLGSNSFTGSGVGGVLVVLGEEPAPDRLGRPQQHGCPRAGDHA